jgi:glycosyltransferase involved in cell wall biosynthesis
VVAYALFVTGALRAALGGRPPNVVLSLTTPPFVGIAGAIVAALRNARPAHWTMDVYPDALRAHWPAAGKPWVWAILEWIGRVQYRGAKLVLTPGPRVQERLRRYVPARIPVYSVPLWAAEMNGTDSEARDRERASRKWRPDDLILMYSGNMGRGHRFAEFLEAARQLSSGGPVWAFVGDGPRKGEIEAFAESNPNSRIELSSAVDSSRLARSLAAADVHLVSIAPGWEGIMVPSKLQNVFAVGRPVIFLGPAATEVAGWISASGGGWVIEPGDVGGVLSAVKEAGNPVERKRRGEAALEFARVHFDQQRNCEEIAALLEQA